MKKLFKVMLLCLLGISWQGTSGQTWEEVTKSIRESGKSSLDHFGNSVSLSADGEIVAVGAPTSWQAIGDGVGSYARVYQKTGNIWIQLGEDIEPSSIYGGEEISCKVSLSADGTTLAVGVPSSMIGNSTVETPGYVQIYRWTGTGWVQLGENLYGAENADHFGGSISLSHDGGILAIGAYSPGIINPKVGYARVYSWSGSSWNQLGGNILGSEAGGAFGSKVSLSANGELLAVSAEYYSEVHSRGGCVRVFQYNNSNWSQLGTNIYGDAPNDYFGSGLSLSSDGTTLAIGGPGSATFMPGYVKVFQYSGSDWEQKGTDIIGDEDGQSFGSSLSLAANGNILAIGAEYDDGGYFDGKGSTVVMQWSASDWTQLGNELNGQEVGDKFGTSLSLSGDGKKLAVGSPHGSSNNNHSSGNVRLFDYDFYSIWDGSVWQPTVPAVIRPAIIRGDYSTATNGSFECENLYIEEYTLNPTGINSIEVKGDLNNLGDLILGFNGQLNIDGSFHNNGNVSLISGDINIAGNLYNNSTFTATDGTVNFNGSSRQYIYGENRFFNLKTNNVQGLSLEGATYVKKKLQLVDDGNVLSNGNLVLQSDATGTATVEKSGTSGGGLVTIIPVGGDVTVQRYLDGSSHSGYRYISAPVKDATLNDINDGYSIRGAGTTFSPSTNLFNYTWYQTSPFPNAFFYDQSLVKSGTITRGSLMGESYDNPMYGWETPTSLNDDLSNGEGLALSIGRQDVNLSFFGSLRFDNINLTLERGSRPNSGWHLLGNPYPATLDWELVYQDASTTDIGSVAYLYNSATESYASYNAASGAFTGGFKGKIASGQGFFVRANSRFNSGRLGFKFEHTTGSDTQHFRLGKSEADWEGKIRLKVKDQAGNSDECLLYFIDDATKAYDIYDAEKFFSHNANMPQLSSQNNGQALVMDCRSPVGLEVETFSLRLKAGLAGVYKLEAIEIGQFAVGTEIYFEDRKENILIDLSLAEEYSFNLAEGALADSRFYIHLRKGKVTSIGDDLIKKNISIFSKGQSIHIDFLEPQSEESHIVVCNLSGQKVFAQSAVNKRRVSFGLPQRGIFIVSVMNKYGTITQKIYLE